MPAVPVVAAGLASDVVQLHSAAYRNPAPRLPTLPQRVAGQDVFTWLTRTRAMDISVDTPLGLRLARRDVLVGTRRRHRRRAGVDLRGRVVGTDGHSVVLDGQHRLEPATVIWATGYRPDFGWLPRAALHPDDRPAHTRGLTPVPGLAVLGLPWLHTRGSALLGWVARDAARLADHLPAHAENPAAPAQPSEVTTG